MQWFQVAAEPCQGADAERARRRLMLEARMIFQPCLGADYRAVSIDLRLQCFGPVEGLAGSHKELDAGCVIDRILGIDRLPQCQPVLAERPGWRTVCRRVAGYQFEVLSH